MIISTVYLPKTTVNVRYQCVPMRTVRAGQTDYSVVTGAVRYWVLLIARPQVRVLPGAQHHRSTTCDKRRDARGLFSAIGPRQPRVRGGCG